MSKQQTTRIEVSPLVRELLVHGHALDRVLHNNAIQQQIVTWLWLEGEISFKEVQRRTAMPPGNLGYRIGVLEQARYIEVIKTFKDRRPVTSYRLTSVGLAAWETYLDHMDALMAVLKAMGKQRQARRQGDA